MSSMEVFGRVCHWLPNRLDKSELLRLSKYVMKKSEKIQERIAKLQKTLDSPATPEAMIEKVQRTVNDLKEELIQALQEEETEASEQASKAEKEAKEAEEAQAKSDEEKAEAERKRLAKKPKGYVPVTEDNKEDCKKFLEEHGMRVTKAKDHIASSKPKTSKKVTTVIADNLFRTISGAVNKEMTNEKIKHLDVGALKEAKNHGKSLLKSLRKALGGISDDNSELLKRFESQFNELIEDIEEKISAMKQAA